MPEEIHIINDGEIDIATGKHRRELKWRNRPVQWSELVRKLSTTQRTHETFKEYLAAKKSRQDEIKDIGGFVGGYLQGGRRKHGCVQHRQLITLDIDFAKPDVWNDFKEFDYPGIAAAMYSTHKHSSDNPRFRLLMPLSRPVLPDEYIAIARRIAGNIGIEQFDHTTYQPERLMYWPSTAKDGEYFFDYADGDWLDADAVLSAYHDWRDSSEWPVSDKESEVVVRAIKKQGDPLEKPGVIGAFCRTYSIHDAIERFLGDVYEPCDIEGRYTYKEGSTAAGLITYDDKFAYSHHGTDPVSGKLCNAFDLVRIHLFGLKDEDLKEGTPGNKTPSFTAMQDFATQDGDVRKLLINEKLADAQTAFTDVAPEEDEAPVNDDWLKNLDVDKRGTPSGGIDNVVLILENDRKLSGIAFDDFEKREVLLKPLPWREKTDRYIEDGDVSNLKYYLKTTYDLTTTSVTLEDSLRVIYKRRKFNSVQEYIEQTTWDGARRLDNLFIDYLGAEDCDYVRTVTRKSFVAAVTRVFKPGIKFDNMLTLIGEQGMGKSTILSKMGGRWYSDSFTFQMLGKKEAFEQLQGVWLIEVGEMVGLNKAEVEASKNFISKKEDRYRVSYGKRTDFFPRRCVFFGTTNEDVFLRDSTGNRRFWPVRTGITQPSKSVFNDLNEHEISQVWAEAVHYYRKGENLYLPAAIEEEAVKHQKQHSEYDERTGLVENYLDLLLPETWVNDELNARRDFVRSKLEPDSAIDILPAGVLARKYVSAAEIWCELFGNPRSEMSVYSTRFIHNIMRSFKDKWKLEKDRKKQKLYGLQTVYKRVENR